MMTRIPQLSSNSFWSTRYTPSIVDKVNAGVSMPAQVDYNFQSLQLLSNLAVPNFQGKQAQYRSSIADFTTNVSNVRSNAKTLTAANFLNQKQVSTDSAAVTGEAKSGATVAQYSVGISQVATSQRNDGKSLTTNAYGGVAKGISTLGIKVAGAAERQVSVNVLSTDTNGQVLKKFAKAINNSDAGVQAEVKTKDNTQYLSLISKNTGATNSFAIRDITGTGATALQLDNKVKDSADALYTVNGKNYQSATNKVTIDNGSVSLNLNQTTVGAIKVIVGKDNNKILDGVQNLVTNYNRLNDTLSTSDNVTKRGDRALSSVKNLVGKTRSADFASVGITLDKDTGDLTVDEKKLSNALSSSPDKVKSLLTGGASLGKTIERAAGDMLNTPANMYLKPPSIMDSLNYSSSYNSNSWMAQQGNLIQGLFLNMTV